MTRRSRFFLHLSSYPPFCLAVLLTTGAITLVLLLISTVLGLPALLIFLMMLVTYSAPPRPIPTHNGLIIGACDGLVTAITDHQGLPLIFDSARDQTEHFIMITVEQGLLDSRILRAPTHGTIVEMIEHTPQTDPDDSRILHGDETAILIRQDDGAEHAIVIHGNLIPHQIHMNVCVGQVLATGTPIGILLGLGSVDHFINESTVRLITDGSRVIAGETVLTGAYANAKHRNFDRI